jgi:hypothetical protein
MIISYKMMNATAKLDFYDDINKDLLVFVLLKIANSFQSVTKTSSKR